MSRLERLLTLIDTGTSEAVRKMAASQIGEIQAARPGELHNLLGAVGQLLLWGKSWETRSAAALAVEAILSNVPTWDPAPVVKQEQEQGTEEKEVFPLAQFKIEEVLKREIFTGGRSGQNIEKDSTTLTTSLANIDVSNSNSSLSLSTSKNSRSSVKNESDANMETRLIKSEQTTESGTATTRSLSEEVCPPTKMIKIEQFDTPVKQQQQQPFPLQLQQPTLLPSLSSPSVPESFVAQVKKEEEHNLCTNITQTNTSLFDGTTDTTESTRVKVMQRIREKEARRALEGQQSKERDIGGSSSSSFSIKNSSSSAINNSNTSSSSASMNDTTRLVKTEQPQDSNRIVLETVKGESNDTGDAPTSWPLQHFGDVLVQELGNKLWEVRHGAALGLRTLLQERHVGGAGKVVGMTAAEMCAANERWVETVAARLLEVLARDRFSDFSAAQSVAPVRETCAQALGVLARSLAPAGAAGAGPAAGSIERVLGVLASMGTQTEWFVRYSALLGIRYVVAVRQDLAAVTVPYVFGTVFALACDSDDDVRAVAAATLVPVADEIIDKALVPTDQLIALENLLWRTLGELDDITSATAPVLELLAVLYANKKSPLFAEASREKFEPYVNILLPYINHPLISVRKSAISMISK